MEYIEGGATTSGLQQGGPEPSDTYVASDDEKKLIQKVVNAYELKQHTKRPYEKTWFLIHAFLVGQQWISYNDYTRQFITNIKVPSYRVRLTCNRMLPNWIKRNAKIMRSKPITRVVAASHEDDDIARARHSEQVLLAEGRRTRLEDVDHDVVQWATKTGTGFFKLWWDPMSGARIPLTTFEVQQDPMNPMAPSTIAEIPQVDENGNPEFMFSGNVCVEPVSPFEVEVDPHATKPADLEWIQHTTIRTRRWIKERFPERGTLVKKEDIPSDMYYERRMREIVGILGYSADALSKQVDKDSQDISIFHEHYEHPTKEHPDGRYLCVSGGVLLNPEPDQQIYHNHLWWHPLVPVFDVKLNGRFWGTSVMEQGIPLQKEYNKVRSQEIEDKNLGARPKITVPRGAGINKTSFDSEPGEVVEFTPHQGMRPEYMARDTAHIQIYRSIQQQNVMDMDDLFGIHDVSKGRIPPGVESGVAIELLQESDEDQLEMTIHSLLSAKKELGRRWLSMIRKYWT